MPRRKQTPMTYITFRIPTQLADSLREKGAVGRGALGRGVRGRDGPDMVRFRGAHNLFAFLPEKGLRVWAVNGTHWNAALT